MCVSVDYSNYQVVTAREDKVDYSFTDNPLMIGKWESVDFVEHFDSFKAGEKSWLDDLYLTGLDIRANGELSVTTTSGSFSHSSLTWTEDLIIDKQTKTASRCEIKENKDILSAGHDPALFVSSN